MRYGAATLGTHPLSFWRAAAAALLAATLGTVGHLIGAGKLPTAPPIVLGIMSVAVGATGLARWSGTRRRRCWEALALLWIGQLAVETVLICDNGMLDRPLAAAGVHVFAGLLVGLLVLGGRRILDDVTCAADFLLPRFWVRSSLVLPSDRGAHPFGGPPVLRPMQRAVACPVRGPPRPV